MRIQLHILAGLLVLSLYSNAQTFLWDRTVKSEGFDEAYDLAVDPNGNVYVAGMIEYLADFGNGVIMESMGVHDIFIAKYDSVGNLIWAERAGGRDGDKVQSITLDGQGSIYIAGEFEDTSYWGPIMKVAQGGNNMFVARYDTSGNVIWVRSLGTGNQSHTRGYGVCTDSHGNVYVAGGTMGNTYYDGNFLYDTNGDYDGTITSFDKYGNFRWSKHMGGSDSDKARGVVSDQGNNIYVTGYFSNTADFYNGSVSSQGHTDLFIVKYDTMGTVQWVTSAGDTGFEYAWDVLINVNGQIIVAGDQSRGKFDNNYASCNGMTDAFLAAYDDAGNNLWVTAGGGPEDDEGKGVAHDNAGNLYLIGDYGGSATFPPYSFTGGHYAEPFIASYTPDGSSLRWVRNGLGPSNDRGTGIGVDNSGNIYACGNYDQSLQLGTLTLPGDSLYDIWVTRLSSQNQCFTSASVSGTINCAGMCNGTAMATAVGQAPFNYTWSTIPVQTTQTATGLCAGNYTVTVTDFYGCTSSANITLTDPAPLLVSTSSIDITCYNACDGIAEADPSGQGPFTYSWNTIPIQTTQSVNGLCAGTYTVVVTDANGCTTSADVTLTDPVQTSIVLSSTDITCYGGCNGTATATVGGQGPFTYYWDTNPVQTTETATALCSGSYTVTVTNGTGCTSSQSLTIVDPAQLLVSSSVTAVICHGECNGTVEAIVNGNGPFSYLWNTNPVQTTQTATALCAGSYSVTVTDVAGCTSSTSMLVTEPFALTLSGNVTNATCAGCTDGSINISAGGGTGSLDYLWNNGETTEDLSNIAGGIYIVCITDDNQCSVCDTFEVGDPFTGINSILESAFSIYPNPTSYSTLIHFGTALKNVEMNLYNSLGQKLLNTEITQVDYTLETAKLPAGVYLIEILSGGQKASKPLIVQH